MGSLTETLGTLFAAYGSKLGQAIVEHTIYVLISVAIGFALGLLLGIVFSRFQCDSPHSLHFPDHSGPGVHWRTVHLVGQ